ncbi:MAG: IclR family transcriptional regulator C-terminal domain-containing protein [Candidatus Thiodiazotropha endolucinida]
MKESIRDTADFVKSLEKGLKVLNVFADAEGALTLSEVAVRTNITRAAARRFLLTLTELGYTRLDGRNFKLTPKILTLSAAYLSSDSLPDVAVPFLTELTEQVHESASLSILEGTDIVYVARVLTQRIMSVNLQVGTRLPACCTSMGRAQIAYLSEDELEPFLESANLVKRTPYTIDQYDDLRAEISRVREQGYSLVNQELEVGVISIAVPIFSKKGKVIAAVNVAGHATRISPKEMVDNILPLLQEAGKGIQSAYSN